MRAVGAMVLRHRAAVEETRAVGRYAAIPWATLAA